MITALLLVACMVLLVIVLGLPLLVGPDSPLPDIIGFVILAAMLGAGIWVTGNWWLILPILALVAMVVWLEWVDARTPTAAAMLDKRGMSARTRRRYWLWRVAVLAFLILFASLFVLPAGSAGRFFIPGVMIAIAAMELFRFSYYRSWRGDAHAASGETGPA